jgi:cation:H+ antiporter
MSVAIPACIIGGAAIWLGAKLLVDGSTSIAETFGVSEAVIGLTIVALGTSLPELAVTVVAGLRGQGGVAVGNVLGSNVMNIMGIVGIASIFGGGIAIDSEFTRDIMVVIATSGFVVTAFLRGKEFSKIVGSLMILTYLSYMTYLSGLLDALV